jgi:hypothetical protein
VVSCFLAMSKTHATHLVPMCARHMNCSNKDGLIKYY